MKISSFLILLFTFSFVSLAQNNYFRTNALSFSFNGLNLGSYYGGVGGRFWTSECCVINVSIGGSISERVYDKTETLSKRIEKNKYLNVGMGIEHHLNYLPDLTPYVSWRVSFGYTDQFTSSSYSYGQKTKTNSFNLDLGIGVEYWLIERISISGQHLFNMHLEMGKRSTGSTLDETQDTNGFSVGIGTTSIMLSIYF